MTDEEKAAFVRQGQEALTHFAQASEAMQGWTEVFSERGGDAEFGNDATLVAYFSNDVQTFLTPEKRSTIAQQRTDY